MRDYLDANPASGVKSIHRAVEKRFRGLQGINCRLKPGERSPVREEIDYAVLHRFSACETAKH